MADRMSFAATVAAVVVWMSVCPAHGAEWRTSGGALWRRGTNEGTEVSAAAQLQLVSFAGTNVALNTRASVDGRPISRRITDGNRATAWDFLDDANVLGRVITLDFEGNRLIDRVRVLPPEEMESRAYFLKGYRIEVATEETPGSWKVVALQRVNEQREIDTTADSAWVRVADGHPVAVIARYLRLTVTRQDLPNRVEIGEIEVFGTGYQAAGAYVSTVRDFGRQVNVGKPSWQILQPEGTSLTLQLRTSANNVTWSEWDEVVGDAITAGWAETAQEPVRYAQWRIAVTTTDPLTTPAVTSVSVPYETALVARSARGRVRPRQAVIGAPVRLTYVADVQLGAGDRGVDLIAVDRWGEVEEVRIDGLRLSETDYEVVAMEDVAVRASPLALRLSASSRLTSSARLELDFTTAFYEESAPVALLLGSDAGDPTVLQRVTPSHADSVLVRVTGVLPGLIPLEAVRVAPPIVRPGRAEAARIHFDLGRVQAPVPVSVSILSLSGRVVRHLLEDELLTAGPIAVAWDGMDDFGQPLVPGLYVCRIEAKAERGQTVLKTVGVAY